MKACIYVTRVIALVGKDDIRISFGAVMPLGCIKTVHEKQKRESHKSK